MINAERGRVPNVDGAVAPDAVRGGVSVGSRATHTSPRSPRLPTRRCVRAAARSAAAARRTHLPCTRGYLAVTSVARMACAGVMGRMLTTRLP